MGGWGRCGVWREVGEGRLEGRAGRDGVETVVEAVVEEGWSWWNGEEIRCVGLERLCWWRRREAGGNSGERREVWWSWKERRGEEDSADGQHMFCCLLPKINACWKLSLAFICRLVCALSVRTAPQKSPQLFLHHTHQLVQHFFFAIHWFSLAVAEVFIHGFLSSSMCCLVNGTFSSRLQTSK